MRKVIHSEFEIDLSSLKISVTEENHWFSDQFFSKFSFPFELKINDALVDFFDHLKNYNALRTETIILVKYVHGDIIEDAYLEVDEIEAHLRPVLRYGIDEFPNFNKKISELPLESITVLDIYQHAKTIIGQTWPAVNYNFPQIHTDVIDVDDDLWTHFGGIINNYQAGDFLINEVLAGVTYNRNLMQALPSLLHVLTQGFLDAGYTLKGDILTDLIVQKQLLFSEAKYYNILDEVNLTLNVVGNEQITLVDNNGATYLKTVVIPEKGRYHITGTIQLYSRWKELVYAILRYRDEILWLKSKYVKNHHSGYLYYYDIDVEFDTINDGASDDIKFESSQFYRGTNLLCDIFIDSVLLYDDEGGAIPNISNKNEVNLTKTAPNITFGDTVKLVKNWRNYDLDVRGKEIWMDGIEKNINYSEAFDLQKFEVKYPNRKLNKGISFLLKFQDVGSEEYKFTEIFYDFEGVSTDSFSKDNKTKEITINAVPLPLLYRNGVQTAHSFSDDKSKAFVVMYDGLIGGLNLCQDPSPMLLPQIYEDRYTKWFEFRVAAVTYKWSFKAWEEELRGLKAKGKAYAYRNYHIVRLIQKNEIKPDLYEVEIKLESLK